MGKSCASWENAGHENLENQAISRHDTAHAQGEWLGGFQVAVEFSPSDNASSEKP
jgi:hypothetical protein